MADKSGVAMTMKRMKDIRRYLVKDYPFFWRTDHEFKSCGSRCWDCLYGWKTLDYGFEFCRTS